MAQTSINILMDEELQKEFDQFCFDVGMNMSTAISIFAKTTLREQRIPFDIKTNQPNTETIEAIEEVQRMKADPCKKTYGSFAEIMNEIENEQI